MQARHHLNDIRDSRNRLGAANLAAALKILKDPSWRGPAMLGVGALGLLDSWAFTWNSRPRKTLH